MWLDALRCNLALSSSHFQCTGAAVQGDCGEGWLRCGVAAVRGPLRCGVPVPEAGWPEHVLGRQQRAVRS